jgi:putative flippase GtrA
MISEAAMIPDWDRIKELFRFYQAALLNTIFGIGMYMLLVALGMNMFAAQALSHVLGMAFNYFTYSRHVFRGSAPAKMRFIMSYAVHYVMGLAALAAISRVVTNPYLAGLAAAILVSFINYFILRHLVFKAAKE